MTTGLSSDFCAFVAERLRAENHAIAHRWLGELKTLLPVDTGDIFPTEQVLDHIPALIREIADYVAAEATDAVAANTAIQSKAHELGTLRFEQQASVHQLLREYRLLGSVISSFVREQVDDSPSAASAADAVVALARLNEAVFVLLQMTVDTFVGRYTERIEEQTARLESFNRMVSHELRQPLSSVQLAVELLAGEATQNGGERDRFVDVARRNVGRLADLIRILGTLVRADHDNPQVQTVDLAKIVGDALRQVEDVAGAKNVALSSRVESIDLNVDVSRLELVLVNLLSNGIKYRDPGKPDAFVEVSARTMDGHVQLLVTDNGLGIRADDHARVFKRFVRVHAGHEAVPDGLGLGLAIVAECVKSMRATIQLESAEGVGTTFVITLPVTTQPPSV
jgi:signal transduction histidine kinase